jgi:vacuolar-type H+-ATPase subunit E/Vma4
LRELKLPYGDIVRLRSALQAFRDEPEEEEEVVSAQPAPEPVVQQVAAAQPAPVVAAPQPAKSGVGKVVAWVAGIVVALIVLGAINSGDPNAAKKDEPRETSSEPSNQTGQDQARQEALERARQAEEELATMREKAAHAEREKAEAQRIAAERETESLREAARRAEQEKQEALQRANLAQQEAAMATAQQQDMSGFDDFFQSYINSMASNDPSNVASHFAETVDYGYAKSRSGRASRSEIAEDNRKLITSYPQRSYSDIQVKQVSPMGPNSVRVNYGFRYQYNGKKLAMGSADVWATVERIGERWQITTWSETVNRLR